MKNIIKCIAFFIILAIIWNYVFNILWIAKTPISNFYDEPKNSLDVVYIGSSNAYIHFNTVLAYNLYGYTTGMLSTDVQAFELVEYLIKDSEKCQDPKLYIIDIAKLIDNKENFTDENIRGTVDSMRFSKNRIDAINKALSIRDKNESEYINFYFSFLMYHNRWKYVIQSNVNAENKLYKGYYFTSATSVTEPQDYYEWSESVTELQDYNKQTLLDLIGYIKSNKLNVLFVIPKRVFYEEDQLRLNYAMSIIQENNMEVINFNTLDDLNIDLSTDLYNFAHINVYGAVKYTLYLSKYLKENYDLPDHRNDESYNSWDNEYERFKQRFKEITDKDFDEVLLEYNY